MSDYAMVQAAVKQATDLLHKLKALEKACNTVENDVDTSDFTEEQYTEFAFIRSIQSDVDKLSSKIDYFERPVKREGTLYKNEDGRYECDGITLTSGSQLEYFDEDYKGFYASKVEHNGQDYYIVANGRNNPIEGIRVRIK